MPNATTSTRLEITRGLKSWYFRVYDAQNRLVCVGDAKSRRAAKAAGERARSIEPLSDEVITAFTGSVAS